MFPANVAQRISEYGCCIATALRKSSGTAEVDSGAVNGNLRQACIEVVAIQNSEGNRIPRVVGREGDMNAVKSYSRFIHHGRGQSLVKANSSDLALRFARIAKTGQAISLQGRFLAQ